MDTQGNSLQDLINRNSASGTTNQVNPFIPTARFDDSGSTNPFFVDELKRTDEFELLRQIRKGQAGVQFDGKYDNYKWYQDRPTDENALGNLGIEYLQKYRESKGWGEQNTYARDSWLRFMKGESSNYFWNPHDLEDPSNIHHKSSYLGAMTEGIGKWFYEQDADVEYQKMKDTIDTADSTFTEDVRIKSTDDFLAANEGVARVLMAGGIDLHDYTRNAKNLFGHRFSINNAVIDALQNIRLQKWDENNQRWGSQMIDRLAYGLQDPLLARDFVATTALTLGLGTIQAGASTLAKGVGQTSIAGARAMSVARGAANILQLTSPFTGMVEGPMYKALQAVNSNVGKQAFQTTMARMLAIGTEAAIASGKTIYNDQRNEYDWRNLVFQREQEAFKPDWMQVGIGAATGFGTGGAALGLMRFGLGAIGDVKYIKRGDWSGYRKAVISSLDTWARTTDGLTVFGDTLSGGRGVMFGDLVDSYMKKVTDTRDYASVLVNGTRLFSTAVFSPEVAAKANFDEKAATSVATEFEKATRLPGEVVQQYPSIHPIRQAFDNMMDPDYLKRTGTTYDDMTKLISTFNERRSGILGPTDTTKVGVGTARAIEQLEAMNSVQALMEIADIDRIMRIVSRNGSSFDNINNLHKSVVGTELNFGRAVDRDNFRVLANYEANGKRLSVKSLETLRWANQAETLFDLSLPDGKIIKGNVMRDTLRLSLGLDSMTEVDGVKKLETRGGRIFITDSEDGSNPTFVISVEPDGTLTRHSTLLKKDAEGRIYADSEITKAADYKPENIRSISDMQKAYDDIAAAVKKASDELEAEVKTSKKTKLEKISKKDDSVKEALKDIGKLPTRKVLSKHFNLSSEEAAMAQIVMDTLGMDIEGAIIKIAEARGSRLEKMKSIDAKASIQWEEVESGIHALIRTTKHSDFGSLVHEMGHYNRMLLIGNTEEHKAYRHKVGISDELWDKFLDWTGYRGDWEIEVSKMSKEQRIAEEKFANAWSFYIRSIMKGDGKTNATGLHRLFSAMGDHLGDLGKKMESQTELEKGLDMTDAAKEVYTKLFLRSEPRLTHFWQMAEKNVFKSMDAESRAKLGEHILGTELWNAHKAAVQAERNKAKAKIASIVAPKPKKIGVDELTKSIHAKVTGDAFTPTKKAIKLALNEKIPVDKIEARIAELRTALSNPDSLSPSSLRPNGDPSHFASHVADLTDDQLKALVEGTTLKPIDGTVRWVFNADTKQIDVGFPVMKVTKELVDRELNRRVNRNAAIARIAEAKKKLDEAKARTREIVAKLETKAAEVVETTTKKIEETIKPEVSTEPTAKVVDIETAFRDLTADEMELFKKLSIEELRIAFMRTPVDADSEMVRILNELREERKKELLDRIEAEARIAEADTEMLGLIEELRKEREAELDKLKSETETVLSESISAERAATDEIISATKTVEETEPVEPELRLDQEPEEAISDIKQTTDEGFVDAENRPVPQLTVEEKLHAEAVDSVTQVVEERQAEVVETVVRAADPTIPVEQIVPKRVRKPRKPKINVEQTVSQSVDERLAVAATVTEGLRRQSEAVAEQLPEPLRQVADDIVGVAVARPVAVKDLLLSVLSDPTFADISPDMIRIVEQYIDIRLRYSVADDVLVKSGLVSEEDRSAFRTIPLDIRAALESTNEVERMLLTRTDPKLRSIDFSKVDQSNADKAFYGEIEIYFNLRNRVLSTLGIDEATLDKYLTYKSKVLNGVLEYENKLDNDILIKYKTIKERYDIALDKLASDPDNQELKAIVSETSRDVGYYNAAAERIKNRTLYGSSIASSAKKEDYLLRAYNEIMEEARVYAPRTLEKPAVNVQTAMALAVGLYENTDRSINAAGIDDVFLLGSSDKPTKNLPIVRQVADPKGINTIKQRALILTKELVDNGGKALLTSPKYMELPERWVIEAFDSPTKTLKAAADIGFKVANDNVFAYNAILAYLRNEAAGITLLFPNEFRKFTRTLTDTNTVGNPMLFLEAVLEVNNKAKSGIIPPKVADIKLTERRLAYLLMTDESFTKRFAGIPMQDVIARVYRSEAGVKGWIVKNLELDPNLSIEKVYEAVKDWTKNREGKRRIIGSANVISERIRDDMDNQARTKTTVSGEAADEEKAGVFDTTVEDFRRSHNDATHISFIEKLQALFYEFLKSKKLKEDNIDLGEYFVARLKGSESVDSHKATIELLSDIAGQKFTERQIEYRDVKLATLIDEFFADVLEDPILPQNLKDSVSVFKSERFGIGKKKEQSARGKGKSKNELNQANLELEIGTEIRDGIFDGTIKSAKDLLETLGRTESEYAGIARQLLVSSNRELDSIAVYPFKTKSNMRAAYNARIMGIVFNADIGDATTGRFVIHEALHSITGRAFSELEGQVTRGTGKRYIKGLRDFVAKNKTDKYTAEIELVESYLDAIDSGSFKVDLDAINDPDKYVGDLEYGLMDIHEFVSEALSNPKFAAKLNEISTTTKADRTVLNKLLDAIASWLGITSKEDASLLEKVVLAVDDIAKREQFSDDEWIRIFTRANGELELLDKDAAKRIKKAFEDESNFFRMIGMEDKIRNDLSAAKGRLFKQLEDDELYQAAFESAISSEEFKTFFGDSVVTKDALLRKGLDLPPTIIHRVQAEKKPLIMYHGSSMINFRSFNTYGFSESRPDLLFGNGVYLTESAETAATYAKPRKGRQFIVGDRGLDVPWKDDWTSDFPEDLWFRFFNKLSRDEQVHIEEYLAENSYEYQIFTPDELGKLFRYLSKTTDDIDYEKNIIPALKEVYGLTEPESGPGVFPLYVSIEKPIDADNAFFTLTELTALIKKSTLTDNQKKRLVSHLNEFWDLETYLKYDALSPEDKLMADPVSADNMPMPFSHGYDPKTGTLIHRRNFFQRLQGYHVEHLMLQAFMDAGYDGITHIGGTRVKGQKPHVVFISWKPGQIKSVFNFGTWDKLNPDILNQSLTPELIDAVDLRRRKLAELGLNEELTPDDVTAMQRILNGLSPVDVTKDHIFSNIKTTMELSPRIVSSTKYMGAQYRKLTTDERRDFISNTLMPRIQQAMGDRNSTAGVYSAASDTTFGKKVNSLIGGAIRYGDTADSNSIFIQFVSKIFDPMMDLRDGELRNKWNMPSVDKLNAEVNNILLRSGLIQMQDKLTTRIKDRAELERINNTAWLYLTRPEAVPDGPNKDLILGVIKARNEFNRITVEVLSNYGELSKKTDPMKYGTSHVVNSYAKNNQKQFVDALVNHAVRKTIDSNEISVITAEALGWVDLRRDAKTDEIVAITIKQDSPLVDLIDPDKIGKKQAWDKDMRSLFSDVTKLSKEAQETHHKALFVNDDYVDSWKQGYASKGNEFTAMRQSMEIAKNRYLGISFDDSKSANPRRMSLGEGRNYTEERILTHDEIASDAELHKFFSTDIMNLSHTELRGHITDAMMTKYLTDFFGVRLSMSDLLQILATTTEEFNGRSHLSLKEIESRKRGYERLRDSWDNSVGNMVAARDSVDRHYATMLDNAKPIVVLASGLRAGLLSVPETARAILTSNKHKSKIMQVVPNLVKLMKMVGPGGKKRRLARAQMISASHWLRGLATDHMLHRHGIHPENPFQGVVFGQGAGGMVGNFLNTWRLAGEKNKTETSSLGRLMNRTSAFASAAEAPLAFVNDCTTLLHIWNAQENLTTNVDAFKKMAKVLNDNPAANYDEFASLAKKCGLLPKEALDLNTARLLDLKYIEILEKAAKDQSLYTDGILDVRKMYVWAGEDADRIEAINRMGGYINMTARHTNVEPTLLDIRVNTSLFGRAYATYMQFLLSIGVQEIGRRRRTHTSGYTEHLAGLLLMDIVAAGTARALANPEDNNMGGVDEFERNPMDYLVRTATSMPLLGSYSWLGTVMRHAIMGTSEFLGGPAAEQDFRVPDLIGGPISTSPRRLLNTPETIKGWYNEGHRMLNELLGD